jgi:hypothetical protein
LAGLSFFSSPLVGEEKGEGALIRLNSGEAFLRSPRSAPPLRGESFSIPKRYHIPDLTPHKKGRWLVAPPLAGGGDRKKWGNSTVAIYGERLVLSEVEGSRTIYGERRRTIK